MGPCLTIYRPGTTLWVTNNGSWTSRKPERMAAADGWSSHRMLFPMPVMFAAIDVNDRTYIDNLQALGIIT